MPGEVSTYGEALRTAVERLRAAGVPSPEWDARIMAAHLIHTGHMSIPLAEPVLPGFTIAYGALVQRRVEREPLQHILGVAWFGPLELTVGPGVFIPRPETEVLAEWAAAQVKPGDIVVDLCTGSGALAAYLAHARAAGVSAAPVAGGAAPAAGGAIVAVEISDEALPYARANLEPYGVELVHADATAATTLAQLNGTVDVLVTNPPYVPETTDLEPEVYADPHLAVFGGGDGMAVIGKLVPRIADLLRPGGVVGLEHDDATSPQVIAAFAADGRYTDIAVLRDLNGIARFVTARKAAWKR